MLALFLVASLFAFIRYMTARNKQTYNVDQLSKAMFNRIDYEINAKFSDDPEMKEIFHSYLAANVTDFKIIYARFMIEAKRRYGDTYTAEQYNRIIGIWMQMTWPALILGIEFNSPLLKTHERFLTNLNREINKQKAGAA